MRKCPTCELVLADGDAKAEFCPACDMPLSGNPPTGRSTIWTGRGGRNSDKEQCVCSKCGNSLAFPVELQNETVNCPYCKMAFQVQFSRTESNNVTSFHKPEPMKQGKRPSTLGSCPDCGNMVSIRAASCPSCGAPQEAQATCPDCGNAVAAKAKSCPDCGAPREAQQPTSLPSQPENAVRKQAESSAQHHKSAKEAYLSKSGMGLIDLIPGIREAPTPVKWIFVVVAVIGAMVVLHLATGK